jgi:hydroxyacyl-ACP dehydratase HTD2-like protein with hotdog domain
LLFIFIYYVVINAVVKPTKIKEAAEVNEEDIRNITIAPVVLFAFSLLLFLAKGIFYLLVREYV